MANYYVDYVNGNNGNSGASWALAKKNPVTTVGSINYIAKSPDPVSLGSCTWAAGQVTLGSAQTLTVHDCDSAWTASANVTCATEATIKKQGTASAKQTIASGFTTGKVAYKALAGVTDFSAYAKVTFWIYCSIAVTANTFKLQLCSDNAGVTPVDEFTITHALGAARWYAITLPRNGGGSLSNSIQSVALYALLDPGTVIVYLDNIEACNDFHLQSLIGKNTGADEPWMTLLYIKGTDVRFGCQRDTTLNVHPYPGVTGAATTYYRNPIVTVNDLATASTTVIFSVAANSVEFHGGYNTATSLRDGETFFSGMNGWGWAVRTTGTNFKMEHVSLVNYNRGISGGGAVGLDIRDYWSVNDTYAAELAYGTTDKPYLKNICSWAHHSAGLSDLGFVNGLLDGIYIYSCTLQAITFAANTVGGKISNFKLLLNQSYNILADVDGGLIGTIFNTGEMKGGGSVGNISVSNGGGLGCVFKDVAFNANGVGSHILAQNSAVLTFLNCTFAGATTGLFSMSNAAGHIDLKFYDCTSTTAIRGAVADETYSPFYSIKFMNHGQVAGVNGEYQRDGWLERDTVNYRTANPCIVLTRKSASQNTEGLKTEARFSAPLDNGVARTLKIWGKKAASFTGKIYTGVKLNDQWLVAPTEWAITTGYTQRLEAVSSGQATKDGVVELVVYLDDYPDTTTPQYVYLDDFEWS